MSRALRAVAIGGVVLALSGGAAIAAITFARNSGHLDGVSASGYVGKCDTGALVGAISVPKTLVMSAWTQLQGFGSAVGPGTRPNEKRKCRADRAFAKHRRVGVYRVSFATKGPRCKLHADEAPPLPIVVTVSDGTPLVATFSAVCDKRKRLVDEVHVFDQAGNPADASFVATQILPVVGSSAGQ
jgi:hypothetical protein